MGRTYYLQSPYADNAPAHEASHRRGRFDLRKTAPGQGSFPHEQCHPGFVEERAKGRVRSSMSFRCKRELLVQLAPAMAVLGSGAVGHSGRVRCGHWLRTEVRDPPAARPDPSTSADRTGACGSLTDRAFREALSVGGRPPTRSATSGRCRSYPSSSPPLSATATWTSHG
jgi:hypothetical protein